MVRGPRSKRLGPWSTELEPWFGDRVSRLKLRGSRLVDAEQRYLGWLLDLERIGSRGGAWFGGGRASDLG